jgi:N-acetylmuramoyl-L-alanine amidase/Stage II sporulation protein
MQKKAFFSLIFAICVGAFLFSSTVSLERVYDYARIETKIKPISSNLSSHPIDIVLSGSASSFVLGFPRDIWEDRVSVTWSVDGQDYIRELDTEETDDTEALYTFPMVTDARSHITLQIHGYSWDTPPTLIATDTTSYHTRLSWHMPTLQADDAVRVVSRSEWWADESIRYRDSQSVAKKIVEWEARGKTPRIVTITPEEQAAWALASQKESAIGKVLGSLHTESFTVASKIRYENWHKLVWPIMRSKSVDRIVVHHTAENIKQDADDMTILRAMYAYHARTRGWGDIGYNYVVGQDGTIYEWRAGGDYTEGSHAYANNLGTVGISVMGNFEVDTPSAWQVNGLEDAIVMVARKYGIDVREDTVWFRTCDVKKDPNCVIDERKVKKLHTHRDVWHTACAGKNLYSLLDDIRVRVANRVWQVAPVYNMETPHIDPLPGEDRVTYVLASTTTPPTVTPSVRVVPTRDTITPSASLGWLPICVRLSYPTNDTISLSLASPGLADLRVWARQIRWNNIQNITVWIVWNNWLTLKVWEKVYSGSSISYKWQLVRIDSWSRVPSWDTAGKYNDNIFRAKITLRNEWWQLLVVNELPLEDYLRWLGEVSNTDNTEKIKTITVAARSYARYYMDRTHRKYSTPLYDGSDDPNSFQKYLGYGYESRSPNVSQAVKDTLRQVIIHKNQIIKAWYHSSSDGRTLSALEYCQKNGSPNCVDIPYLQSVSDPGGEWRTRSGHGVGISWIGATYWAQQGWDHKKIIQYYMNGVEIQKK